MTMADPADMPFRSREQAEHAFAGFRQAAGRGGGQHLAEALTDTIETLIARPNRSPGRSASTTGRSSAKWPRRSTP